MNIDLPGSVAPETGSAQMQDAPAPRLRSITIPRAPGQESSLLDLLVRDDSLVWGRRGEGLVGFGEAVRFVADGPDRFRRLRRWWADVSTAAEVQDDVDQPGTGPVAFSSIAFSGTSAHASRLIVPRVLVGRSGDHGWLTLITDDPEAELSAATAEAELAGLLEETSIERDLSPGSDQLVPGRVSEDQYEESVRAGVRAIAAGELTKLVLARDAVAELGSPLAVSQVLRELALRYADCWTYSVDGLIGSTPEMLVKVSGNTARARVLAGTLDRATAPAGDDGYAERMLSGNEKQRHEHRLAIDSLTLELGPLVTGMVSPEEPFVLELPNVWHLASDVEAQLRVHDDGTSPSALDLAEVLHPTAAVCGTPTATAADLILRLEKMDRGPYAGPVGWVDAMGNGEFGIALRGGVIESPTSVRLYAGCGIVAASDPAAELAESWAKMRPMREALNL
ncbi:isochorismate synthase [Arthrobacter rhombi]|uniref:isochorismate synthase n=1 Tax=Arthrobacter rhombi TaxID=71253 RepID=A0A1R4GV86_9MICC|nr:MULTISPECIES: isochorismate synthase [Micrococcaceae]SJM72098.1 Menaquinone-specific isochorismate synthase [Arthrobacter rhombi]